MCNPRICQMATEHSLHSASVRIKQTGCKELREAPGAGMLVYGAWVHASLSP